MEMKVYSVFQKYSSIINLNLVPAFRSKYEYTVVCCEKLKPLNKNETGVACSTLILSHISRQRDMTKHCLLTVNNRKQEGGGGGKAAEVVKMAVADSQNNDLDVAFRQYSCFLCKCLHSTILVYICGFIRSSDT